MVNGAREIVPLWETVEQGDILTPAEVFALVRQEGFSVDYARVAIVCNSYRHPERQSQYRRLMRRLPSHNLSINSTTGLYLQLQLVAVSSSIVRWGEAGAFLMSM